MSRHSPDVVSGYAYRESKERENHAYDAAKSYREAYLGLRKELREYIRSGGQLPDHLIKASGIRRT